jgi:hypothetical protein
MKKPILVCLLACLILPASLSAREQEEPKKDTVKTGFVLSGVPAVAYNTDIGFLYGLILNQYHYGDGSRYPRYNHSIYMEWSNTTKGSMKSILRYDSDRLIPGIRSSDLTDTMRCMTGISRMIPSHFHCTSRGCSTK